MRYVIETNDEEGIIGMQISKWEKDKKLNIIEKGETLIVLQAHMERIAKALELLKKAGYNSYVMKSFIRQETKERKESVEAVLRSQEDFFRQIGVLKK